MKNTKYYIYKLESQVTNTSVSIKIYRELLAKAVLQNRDAVGMRNKIKLN